jgi:uncharacterized protein (TIGR02996 family)
MDTLNGLLAGIVADPVEETRWLVLADWLAENDDPRRGELLWIHRWLLSTCVYPEQHPQRAAFHARVVELLEAGVRPCVPQETLQIADGVEMTFSFIPPHTFRMGRVNGEYWGIPAHVVTLTRGFYLGVYPVTEKQWFAVTGETSPYFEGDNRPVIGVTWEECRAFCVEVSKRTGRTLSLPTAAQWEAACRAGTTTEFHTGDGEAAMRKAGWYCENRKMYPDWVSLPVGQLLPNAWGLYDMHGNVWEFCQDFWGPYPTGYVIDPTGPELDTHRVIRGGCLAIKAEYCSSPYRTFCEPDINGGSVGFRVALALPGG